MKNLTFKAAMLKGSQPTVNRQSTDGQSQRHCKQTPLTKRWKVLMTLVFLFTLGIGQMWGTSPYSLDITSYGWGGTGNKSANDGTITVNAYVQSKTYNNNGSTKVA